MFLRQRRFSSWKKFFTYDYFPHINVIRDTKYENGETGSQVITVYKYLVPLPQQFQRSNLIRTTKLLS